MSMEQAIRNGANLADDPMMWDEKTLQEYIEAEDDNQ